MTVTPDMAERHSRQLARYAERALALAEDVCDTALATPAPEQKARCAEAFHRLGQALRQSIAWEARLARDHARDLKAAETEATEVRTGAVRRRHDQVRAGVERQIYAELEPSEAAVWLADFVERLEIEVLDDKFLDEPLDDHIARLSETLGLTGETPHDYVPRACRAPPSRWSTSDILRMFPGLANKRPGADDDEPDESDPGADAPSDATAEIAEVAQSPESHEPPAPSADPSASSAVETPAPDPPPSEDEIAASPPEPEPPPRPPEVEWPKPYIPPWEINPHARYPGGSGW